MTESVEVLAPERPPLRGQNPIIHAYEPYSYGGRVFCSHVEVEGGVGRVCDRPEQDHAPAEDTGAGTWPGGV